MHALARNRLREGAALRAFKIFDFRLKSDKASQRLGTEQAARITPLKQKRLEWATRLIVRIILCPKWAGSAESQMKQIHASKSRLVTSARLLSTVLTNGYN